MGKIPGRAENDCIELFEAVLGMPARRRHVFGFLRGDPTPARPQGTPLQVDAYFPDIRLVVEYMGRQHFESNRFMDKRPGRREQRRKYDLLRDEILPRHGITLIRVRYDEPLTEKTVRTKLIEAGLEASRKAAGHSSLEERHC